MANVHRQYVIADDAYYVRVEGSKDIHQFTGSRSEKESYEKLRQLHDIESKKDPRSKFIDHAQH